MALISDPRIFVLPRFRFERDGTFVADGKALRPQPNEIFNCKYVQRAPAVPSMPWRNDPEGTSIIFGPTDQPVLFVSSVPKDFPLFWHAEIMTDHGKVCDEDVYDELWDLRKSANAAYFSFGEKKRPVPLKVEGRLLEIVVYLLFFEADDGAASVLLERLQQQELREVVLANWDALTVSMASDLSGRRASFSKQLSTEHSAAAEVCEWLG